MKQNLLRFGFVAVLVAVILTGCSHKTTEADLQAERTAQALTARGITMYGAFWCPHCQTQKKNLGSAFKYINYVECSTPDGRGQVPICTQKGITSYPTWDGFPRTPENPTGRYSSVLTLEELAERANLDEPTPAGPTT